MSEKLKRHSVRGVMYNGEEICGGFAYYDADEVDALLAEKDKEIRRLRRALYKACANWAFCKYIVKDKYNEYSKGVKWLRMLRKCGAKAKEYK